MKLVRRLLGEPEVIGDPACPIVYRWTLWGSKHTPGKAAEVSGSPEPEVKHKLLLHYFLPDAHDRHPHDHPRGFWTFVLRGFYTDIAGINGEVEQMTAGTLRYRPALHTHRTISGPKGCWTLALMGELKREWGFHVDGDWWPWKAYHKTFGHSMRCP